MFKSILLSELMAKNGRSINPLTNPDMEFELYSIPAYEAHTPEFLKGKEIGSSKQILEKNDVLLSRIVPHIRRAWIVEPKSEKTLIGSGEWVVFRSQKVDPGYLRNFLLSDIFHPQMMATVRGVGGSLLRAKPELIGKIEIPLPPLEVQKKIAAVLEKADALRRKREEQIKRLDDLLQATFLDMFGDPVTNPKGWPMQKFGNCISNIRSGWSAKAENRPAVGNEYGVFKISAVTTGRFIKSENKYVKNIDSKRVLIIPQKGDLLFSRANTRELVAAVCLVEEDCKNLFLPDKLWKIEALENTSTKEFLRYVIMDPGIHEKITTKATGTSGSMLNVSQQKFLSVDLPLPPFQLQKFFSSLFWKTIEQRKRLDAAFNLIKSNFNSLMQRAFKGELELK